MIRRFTAPFERMVDPFAADREPLPPRGLWAFCGWTLREMPWAVGGLLAATLAFGVLDLWAAWWLGRLVDMASGTAPGDFLAAHWASLAAAAAVFLLLRPAAHVLQSAFQSLVVGPGVFIRVIWRLHRHVLGHSMAYFQDDYAGRLSAKEMQGASALSMAVLDGVMSFGLMAVYVLGMAAMLAVTDWRLALATLVWVVLFAAFVVWRVPHVRAASRARAEARAMVSGRLVDSLSNIITVKLFAHAEREKDHARAGLEHLRETSFAFGRQATSMRVGIALLGGLGTVLIVGIAIWLWMAGRASLGDLGAATAMILRATQMSGWVAWSAVGVFDHLGTVEDAAMTLARPHALTDRPGAAAPGRVTGAVAFEDVSFRYGRAAGGVDALSLRIRPGERVGLVGRSGAGKSTLVSLLLRLHDVETGRVTLDGTDIRDLRQDGLRRRIGMVTQDTAMFNRSALDNILYGAPDGADREAAIDAARRARAHDFILDLADPKGRTGYDAHIGERGVKLSGGQRQRIAIARALLKDAPILVLDEATSALDSEVEAEIQRELADLMRGRTVIAIAHRLSTIAHLDRIVVMDGGRIVEDGPHEALIARGGLYAGFWSRQSGGFLDLAAE